jgi:hypothetical protein
MPVSPVNIPETFSQEMLCHWRDSHPADSPHL